MLASGKIAQGSRCVRQDVWRLAGSLFLLLTAGVRAEPAAVVNETLNYSLRWGMVYAGNACLSATPDAQRDGQSVVQCSLTVQSSAFVDRIYKVRDRMDSWLTPDLGHTLFYSQNQMEGRHRSVLDVSFDWVNSTAQRVKNAEAKEPLAIPAGTFDPLGALFVLRRGAITVGDDITLSITDGKRCVLGQAHVLRREKVRTAAGEFDCLVVEPDLHDVKGVFEKSRDAKLHVWVTDDARHIPVKVASKVVIGYFTAELTSIQPDKPAP